MNPAIIITIIGLLLDKGVPATINILEAWKKKDPSLSDLIALQSTMKRPEDF